MFYFITKYIVPVFFVVNKICTVSRVQNTAQRALRARLAGRPARFGGAGGGRFSIVPPADITRQGGG
jgi:hypothetical protein